jgi:hypothetical protein
MATALPSPMGDDPDFVAEIAKVEGQVGPLSAEVIETRWRLRLQAHNCAAGNHVYTWSGEILDLPGGSPHQVMACAYAALHRDGTPSPRLIGPVHTPKNAAKRLWSEQELKEHTQPKPSDSPQMRADGARPNSAQLTEPTENPW